MQKLASLVENLPELYQPVFGYSNLSEKTSRSCDDRLQHINRVYSLLSGYLNRPLKVLDLGCAQGFFSLSLAKQGATVKGVDFLKQNIELCQYLADENDFSTTGFVVERIENVINSLKDNEYDLVLGLSVFHHLVHEHGSIYVRELFTKLANSAAIVITELALKTEPLYWAGSLPECPETLIEDIAFFHQLSEHSTHLSEIKRPLYFASNKFWLLADKLSRFDCYSTEPHALANNTHGKSRRYYFSETSIAKYFKIAGSDRAKLNHNELSKEVSFLSNPPLGFKCAELIASGENTKYAWVVQEKLEGSLLLDAINVNTEINFNRLFISLLDQLIILESSGLYHNDLRAWNIILSEKDCYLIDYGSISNIPKDCVWPSNVFLSFLIFVNELLTNSVNYSVPERNITMLPEHAPFPFNYWLQEIWDTPAVNWSFAFFKETFLKVLDNNYLPKKPSNAHYWMFAIEQILEAQKRSKCIMQLEHSDLLSRITHLEIQSEKDKLEWFSKMNQMQLLTEQYQSIAQRSNEFASNANVLLKEKDFIIEELRANMSFLKSSMIQSHTYLQQLDSKVSDIVASTIQEQLSGNQQNNEVFKDLKASDAELTKLHAANHQYWLLAEQRQQQINALLSSWSWRLTAPLRFVLDATKTPLSSLINLVKWPLIWPAKKLVAKVLENSQRAIRINYWLMQKMPFVHRHLRQFAIHRGLMREPFHPSVQQEQLIEAAANEVCNKQVDLAHLTPRARQIYQALTAAIAKNKE